MNRTRDMLSLCLHGLSVKLGFTAPLLGGYLEQLLEPFLVSDLPEQVIPTVGMIGRYEAAEVIKHLSTTARRVPQVDPWIELYQDDERFWLVDERWGLTEINFLRGRWRSWVLAEPTTDAVRVAEGAVLWPLAQLLRQRGLHLLPAVSVAREGWGVLMVAPFSLEPELMRLVRGGYRVTGQRWTALREEDGRIHLLHVPGVVERTFSPRLRSRLGASPSQWMDLEKRYPGVGQHHAFCDLVAVIEPGRRSAAHAADLSVVEAEQILRAGWPIIDVHPSRRAGPMPQRMAQLCRCAHVQLSRNPEDLLVLLDSLRDAGPGQPPQVALFTRGGTPRMTIRRLTRVMS